MNRYAQYARWNAVRKATGYRSGFEAEVGAALDPHGALYEPVRAAVAALGGVVQETQYAAAVTLCALLPEEAGEAFAAQVRDLTAGRCAVRPVGETERAVPLADTGL